LTKKPALGAELFENPEVAVGDLVAFSGRYAMYTESSARWVIQLTPTYGLVINIEPGLVTVFTGESSCVVNTSQQDVRLEIISRIYE
jgi:hypothetical protein